MTLHKEGTATILLSTVFVIIINAGVQFLAPELGWLHNVLIIGSIFLMVMILQFFRKPDRETITDLNLIIAPADGKVVVIEETFEGEYYFHVAAKRPHKFQPDIWNRYVF
jgi:phosphatidylserine decarboxylase